MKNIDQMTVSELQAESDRCESSLGEAEKIIADLRARLGSIRSELAKRLKPSSEPRVSDHALLRYIERVMDIDIEAIRHSILDENVKAALKMGATGVTVDGIKMIAKDGTIVTVLSEDMRPKRKTKKGWRELDDTEEQIEAA